MSNPYTLLCSRVLFPLHEALKRHNSVAIRRRLEQSQWWTAEELRRYQTERLQRFLGDVFEHVPYYRRLAQEHGYRTDLRTVPELLGQLPLLTKQLIRENFDQLRSTRAGSLRRFNTGGSSGEPLIFLLGNERVSHDVAAKWRATRWWDVDIGDREIVVWGSPIELNSQDRARFVRDRVLRTWLLPAFEMSVDKLDVFVARIRSLRPAMLFGYPSSLTMIARHAASKNIPMNNLGIRVAFVTSERLYDEQRQTIGSTFGCRVANGYGGRDSGFIAHECPAGSMHISAEDMIVETVDDAGLPIDDGNPGEIVVTHMATGEFPFVRYRTGDVGVIGSEPCGCGRGLPVLKEIQGRTTDFVVASDGTVMHGLALIYVLRDMPGVARFKIIQENLGRTRVLVVRGSAYPEGGDQQIVTAFRARLGAEVSISVESVSEIPAEKSGKFRYVVSNVSTKQDVPADARAA